MGLLNEIDSNILDRLKFPFPKTIAQIKDNSSYAFARNSKLEEYFNSKIENSTIYIFNVNSKESNAFTVPGIEDLDKFISNPIVEYDKAISKLSSIKLTAVKTNSGLIRFNRNIKFIIFITTKLQTKILDNDILFAITLHELGHWIYHKSAVFNQTFSNMVDYFELPFRLSCSWLILRVSIILENKYEDEYRPYDVIVLFIFLSYISIILFRNYYFRKSEFDSDSFALDMGYGRQLLLGLKKLDSIKSSSTLVDILALFKDRIFGILFHNHPSLQSREFQLDDVLSNRLKNLLPWIKC